MYRVCPACGEPIPQGVFACRTDWFRLPKNLRDDVDRTWNALNARNAQTYRDYRAAKKAAQDWFSKNDRSD